MHERFTQMLQHCTGAQWAALRVSYGGSLDAQQYPVMLVAASRGTACFISRAKSLFLQGKCPTCCLQAELEQLTEQEGLTTDEVLLRRMDAGLYTLQQCALIIGNLWIVGDQLVKQRIMMLLHQQVHVYDTKCSCHVQPEAYGQILS